MAVNANLTTYPGAMMSPQDFAVMIEKISSQQTGILYGCTASSTGGSTVNVASGWVLVKGRLIQIDSGSLAVQLPTSTATRYVYVTVDLANTSAPCTVSIESTTKTDSADFNVTNGTAYCLLATLTVTSSGITNVSNAALISANDTINDLKDIDTKLAGNIAAIETSPAAANHAVGTYLIYNGQLYKVTSAITAGQNLTVGTNISAITVASAKADATDGTLLWNIGVSNEIPVQMRRGGTNNRNLLFSVNGVNKNLVNSSGVVLPDFSPALQLVSFTSSSTTFNANASKSVNVSITVPTGFSVLMYGQIKTSGFVGNGYVASQSGNTLTCWVQSIGGGTGTITVDVLFVQNR